MLFTNPPINCLKFLFALLFSCIVFAANEQISINFQHIKIRDLLYLLAEHSGKNIIISENISGKTTINLRETSWREALDITLQMQGLGKTETANTIIIAPIGEFEHKGKFFQPTVLNLHHTSASDIAKILAPSGLLSQSGKITAESRTNKLVIADASNKIANIASVLQQVDVPIRQVLIEARIVSADTKFSNELGLEFSSGKNTSPRLHPGKFNMTLAKLTDVSLLDLELAALESEGRGKVISKPKLLTADRQTAYIESGAEIPYQEKTKEGNTSVVFKKAALSLKVTPEVMTNNTINLLLQLNQDKVSPLTINGVPAIDTRKIQTQTLVRSGETIVLGGIYEWSNSNHKVGVPILGKIPLIGLLLQRQEKKSERKELLMFVTPRIVAR